MQDDEIITQRSQRLIVLKMATETDQDTSTHLCANHASTVQWDTCYIQHAYEVERTPIDDNQLIIKLYYNRNNDT